MLYRDFSREMLQNDYFVTKIDWILPILLFLPFERNDNKSVILPDFQTNTLSVYALTFYIYRFLCTIAPAVRCSAGPLGGSDSRICVDACRLDRIKAHENVVASVVFILDS